MERQRSNALNHIRIQPWPRDYFNPYAHCDRYARIHAELPTVTPEPRSGTRSLAAGNQGRATRTSHSRRRAERVPSGAILRESA